MHLQKAIESTGENIDIFTWYESDYICCEPWRAEGDGE